MMVIRRLIVVVTAVLVGFLGSALALPGAAVASAGKGGPIALSPAVIRPLFAKASSSSSPPLQTVTAPYSCDFSKYENTSNPTIAPATGVNFDSLVQTSWPVNVAQDIPLGNEATIALPAPVSSQLTGVNDFTITSTAVAKNATKTPIAFAGDAPVASATATTAPTEIPMGAADAQVTFPKKGTGAVELPVQAITITPVIVTTKGATPKAPITCTTTQAAADVSVTVGDASGPFYTCKATDSSGTSTASGITDMTVTESGTEQAGKSVTVTLSSVGVAGLIVALGAGFTQAGTQLTKVTFTSSLGVTGDERGTLKLASTVTDPTATSFSASGSLKLTEAGTVKVDIPRTWDVKFFTGTLAPVQDLDVACTLVTKPAPVGLSMTVTSASSGTPSASPSPASNGGEGDENTASPEGTAVPSGAPNTGGGPIPGGDVPLMLAGVALFLTGGGLVLRTVAPRRRRVKSGER
jgi:hypothetical protein